MSNFKQWANWTNQGKSSTPRKIAGAAFGAYLVVSNLLLFTAPHLMHR